MTAPRRKYHRKYFPGDPRECTMQICSRVTPQVYDEFALLAEERGITLSQLFREILEAKSLERAVFGVAA